VDLGGIDGLVHKSELSWNKVNNPETAYAIGEEVEAEVIDINHERGRISLSIRRLQPDPWQESVAKYTIGDVIDGTVTKLVNFGAFVRIEEGLEGLIHISELSNSRVAHPGDVVSEGQELKLKIISLDSERHRLGLSLKQTEDRTTPMVQPRYEETPGRSEGGAPLADRAERTERLERTDRSERGDRRDRGGRGGRGGRDRDYRPEDATAEPEEGIDNTMAAAFAESGLLDQFRTDEPAADAAAEPAVVEAAAEAVAEEPAAAEVVTEEPAAAEAVAEETAEVEAVAVETSDEPAAVEVVAEKPAAEKVKAAAGAKTRKRKTAAAEEAAGPAPEEAPASSEPEEG
jgi:small subunit ribosomal protein S1